MKNAYKVKEILGIGHDWLCVLGRMVALSGNKVLSTKAW